MQPISFRSRRDVLGALGGLIIFSASASSVQAEDEIVLAPGTGEFLGPTVARAVASGIPRVRLQAGRHGPQTIQSVIGNGVEIVGDPGAVLDMTMLRGTSGLTFKSVDFRGEKTARGAGQGLVYIDQSTSQIAFEQCSFATMDDVSGWSPPDWVNRPYNRGLAARGSRVDITNCRFFNLRDCLWLAGDNSSVKKSRFESFGNDGIEFGANNIEIRDNSIRGSDHTRIEPEHADGIQGFPAPNNGVFSNILIEGNTVEFVGPGDYMQGISIFDGNWRDVRVVNNKVSVNMWNAIALYGIDGVRVESNTVSTTDQKIRNWIEVRASKGGRHSTNVIIRSNIAPLIKAEPGALVLDNRIQFP